MTTKYVHIRPGVRYDTAAKKLVGAPEPKGGITIAFRLEDEEGVGALTYIDVAIARCHRRDAYSRSRGRAIAGGRLAKGDYNLAFPLNAEKGIVEQVVENVGSYLEFCDELREAA
jgi:hypothetical protein